MKKILLFVTMMAVNAFAVERKQLMPLIEEASVKKEAAYLEVRGKITGYGTNALPLLASVAVDQTLPWQQQLVARICYERIQRKEEIEKLTATDWYAHPKFEERWNNRLSGPEGQMFDMIVSDLKKAGLWYYYLEVEWKMTGELAEIRDSHKDGYWARCCFFAVKENPEERIWFLRVCADLMAAPPPLSRTVSPIVLRFDGGEKPRLRTLAPTTLRHAHELGHCWLSPVPVAL